MNTERTGGGSLPPAWARYPPLLPRPHRFEGVPTISQHIPNYLRIPKREDRPDLRIDIRAAGSAPTLNLRKHDNVLARIDDLVDPDREGLEGVHEPKPSTECLAPGL